MPLQKLTDKQKSQLQKLKKKMPPGDIKSIRMCLMRGMSLPEAKKVCVKTRESRVLRAKKREALRQKRKRKLK